MKRPTIDRESVKTGALYAGKGAVMLAIGWAELQSDGSGDEDPLDQVEDKSVAEVLEHIEDKQGDWKIHTEGGYTVVKEECLHGPTIRVYNMDGDIVAEREASLYDTPSF